MPDLVVSAREVAKALRDLGQQRFDNRRRDHTQTIGAKKTFFNLNRAYRLSHLFGALVFENPFINMERRGRAQPVGNEPRSSGMNPSELSKMPNYLKYHSGP